MSDPYEPVDGSYPPDREDEEHTISSILNDLFPTTHVQARRMVERGFREREFVEYGYVKQRGTKPLIIPLNDVTTLEHVKKQLGL